MAHGPISSPNGEHRSVPKTNALEQDAISRITAQGIEAGFDDRYWSCGSWTA
jgi:hypothetical protein